MPPRSSALRALCFTSTRKKGRKASGSQGVGAPISLPWGIFGHILCSSDVLGQFLDGLGVLPERLWAGLEDFGGVLRRSWGVGGG